MNLETLVRKILIVTVVGFLTAGFLWACGAPLLAGAPLLLAMALIERFENQRVMQKNYELRLRQQHAENQYYGLNLVEMDVQLAFRDKSKDLRVVN